MRAQAPVCLFVVLSHSFLGLWAIAARTMMHASCTVATVGKQVSVRVRVSTRCNCHRYQLEYYVFKLKTPRLQGEDPTGLCDIIATLHFAHLAPWARYKLHRWLRKWSFIRVNWPTDALRLNWRDAFTKEDEEKAMSYLLGRYSDFVDRRGGSVWQDGCEHYRSNGVLLESHVAALLKEEREKAELPTSVGQEEDP